MAFFWRQIVTVFHRLVLVQHTQYITRLVDPDARAKEIYSFTVLTWFFPRNVNFFKDTEKELEFTHLLLS